MKKILQKYSKELLIQFFCREGLMFRYRSPQQLERKLLLIQWELQCKASQREMDAALADMDAAKGNDHQAWRAAADRFDAAFKRSERADRLHKKADKLLEGA